MTDEFTGAREAPAFVEQTTEDVIGVDWSFTTITYRELFNGWDRMDSRIQQIRSTWHVIRSSLAAPGSAPGIKTPNCNTSDHRIPILPPPAASLPYALCRPLLCSSMSLLRLLKPAYNHRSTLRFSSHAAAAVCGDTSLWTQAPISGVSSAAESLYHVTVDVSDAPFLVSSYSRSGQYLQVRVPEVARPTFLAIASPPSVATKDGVFEFLVKSVRGSTAEALCLLKKGDVVELSQVIGRGFEVDHIEPSCAYPTVLIFATGSGISPIRSLIESGFSANKRSDVRLYYGARNLKRMAYQDRFKEWESAGIEIVPVLSQPHCNWSGERGYVQDAFVRANKIFDPHSAGAVLCGCRQMTEEIRSLLVADGVSRQRILMNV